MFNTVVHKIYVKSKDKTPEAILLLDYEYPRGPYVFFWSRSLVHYLLFLHEIWKYMYYNNHVVVIQRKMNPDFMLRAWINSDA